MVMSIVIPTTTTLLSSTADSNNHNHRTAQLQQKASFHAYTQTQAGGSYGVEIALDESEQRLFDVLVNTVQAFQDREIGLDLHSQLQSQQQQQHQKVEENASSSTPSSSTPSSSLLTIRVAGGWVRDKLLGLQTHDVDVAIDRLTGVQFATLVQDYLRQKQADHPDWVAGRMGVIAANPDQSKHLETATMKVCGIEVDFCNLRAQEIYESNSRIPVVAFGTPLGDAQRRDFTINALFYNLQTRQVEDFLQRSIQDLQDGCIVTPLNPVQTFHDDPLRVLRAIRFAVRYQFTLDSALIQAAQSFEIHHALHIKVSRERVGKELEGMLSGKGANPILALQTISQLKLAGSVFCLPLPGLDGIAAVSGTILHHSYSFQALEEADSAQSRHIRESGWEESKRVLDLLPGALNQFQAALQSASATTTNTNTGLVSVSNHNSSSTAPAPTQIDMRLLPMAVFLLPFRKLLYRHGRKQPNKEFLAVSYVVREGIKFKTTDANTVTLLMETVDQMVHFLLQHHQQQQQQQQASAAVVDAAVYSNKTTTCRLGAGLMLRTLKDMWVTSLVLATVVLLRQSEQQQQQLQDSDGQLKESLPSCDWVQTAVHMYQQIVHELHLDHCWKMRPLLDGKSVIEALDLARGPQVAAYLNEQVKWMLLNPEGTKEECEAHLKSLKRRLEDSSQELSSSSALGGSEEESHLGVSDGTGMTPSSPVVGTGRERHFSKKMHVESMEL